MGLSGFFEGENSGLERKRPRGDNASCRVGFGWVDEIF